MRIKWREAKVRKRIYEPERCINVTMQQSSKGGAAWVPVQFTTLSTLCASFVEMRLAAELS